MPELPEVESLRRDLEARILGARVEQSRLLRPDVLHRSADAPEVPLPTGSVVKRLLRHGKQLVIETSQHGCLLVHLGMSGSLRVVPDHDAVSIDHERHVHARWTLRTTQGALVHLRHRDPRRFGWLESHASLQSILDTCWNQLGPDALTVESSALIAAFKGSRRALKSALLDQSVTAGIGNIYVDESLFRAGLHPCMPVQRLKPDQVDRLAVIIRKVLQQAVDRGGSTIQDHRTADGGWGSFQKLHKVYGRAGLPCTTCKAPLTSRLVQQRMTVFCKSCQPRRPGRL